MRCPRSAGAAAEGVAEFREEHPHWRERFAPPTGQIELHVGAARDTDLLANEPVRFGGEFDGRPGSSTEG